LLVLGCDKPAGQNGLLTASAGMRNPADATTKAQILHTSRVMTADGIAFNARSTLGPIAPSPLRGESWGEGLRPIKGTPVFSPTPAQC
jgi:hypothetical protein